MPLQDIQLALIWPIFPAHYELCFYGILQFVEPLLAIALTTAKLAVEEIFCQIGFSVVCGQRRVASARQNSIQRFRDVVGNIRGAQKK